ncbi:MAG TPA: hypothetical protein PKD24_05265 [Pyrinomonadaceae bacterium]|nr:hypothetical protein [Pyrinomonadaceae bacterium]HMP64960.1 hypothetical protein [Pyrinomonadaceae bacterium]
MLETVEATIDQIGQVTLNEKIRLDKKRKALVTILDEEPVRQEHADWPLVGSVEILTEDLEAASREIAEEMNRAIERSAQEFANAEDHVEPE